MSIAIPHDFSNVNFRQAERLIAANQPEAFHINEQFYDGDHWQDGEGWPQDIDQTAQGAEFLASLIETMFESKNVINEVVTRFLDGLLENNPEITVAPPGDQEEASEDTLNRADQISERIHRWIERNDFHDEVREAIKYAALGERGYLRPFIPRGRRDEQGQIGGPWDEVFRDLYVEAVRPTRALIYTHPDTKRDLSIFHYEPGDTQEVEDPHRTGDIERVELGWVDPDTGETVVRILKEGESPPSDDQEEATLRDDEETLEDREMRVDLGGRLLLQEIEIDPLVTEQVRSSQRSLNQTKTMMSHNEVAAGFNERMFMNAQPPGRYETDEKGNREFVPNQLKRGPFRTHFIQGVTTTDEMGQEQIKDPSVVIDEPDDPDVYIRGKREKRKDILDEVSQTFILMNESSESSGRSRLIARHEFVKTLNKAIPGLSGLYRGSLMSLTIMAETFGQGGPTIGDLRVPIEVYPDSGPLTPEEMDALGGMTESGLMSMQTALSRAGIHDIEAETQRIKEEEDDRLQRLQERAKLVKELVASGASLPGAAMLAGWDEEEARELQTGMDGTLAQAVSESASGNPR